MGGFAPSGSARTAALTKVNFDVPRISLPAPVSEKISDFGLKDPNALDTAEYNSYSGAAIGGTLLMFVGIAYLDGLLVEVVQTFVLSALVGGGAGAYLSLRSDGIGEQANKFGSGLVGLFD